MHVDRALREAVDIAKTLNAKIFLLHVDASIPVVGGDYALSEQTIRTVEKENERVSKAKMFEEISKVAREADVEIEVEERHGPTGDAILNYGQEKGIDLIVIEPHAKKGLKSLLGGTTEQLIKEATCPLLVLPGIDRGLLRRKAPLMSRGFLSTSFHITRGAGASGRNGTT